AHAVVEICRRLDGLPLAIELAAARIRLLSPAMLLVRLERRLAVLTAGAQDLPVRQQTLRATLDWSYHLLSAPEQRLLRRLAVFIGGWTLEALEAVCEHVVHDEGGSLGEEVLAQLESLVDKSLVQQTEHSDGSVRYHLLETVHEYALEQLEACGETETPRRAHATYFLSLSEGIEAGLWGPEMAAVLSRLHREHDNLRAALSWAREQQQTEFGLRLAGALAHFWWFHGHLSEG